MRFIQMRFIQMNLQWHLLFLALVTATAVSRGEPFRCIMYLTG